MRKGEREESVRGEGERRREYKTREKREERRWRGGSV